MTGNASTLRPKVLLIHSFYTERGGEDGVFEAEVNMLRSRGHEVYEYTRQNADLVGAGTLPTAASTIWSARSHAEITRVIADFKPDIAHVHNTFPAISPSAYWALSKADVPVVQTLHNFRISCPQAMLLRDGRICTDCVGRIPLPAIRHKCFRQSASKTALLSAMLVTHRMLGTWQSKVGRYIALNQFCRDVFVQAGLPADRFSIKPNFVPDEPYAEGVRSGFLYVGRLSPEKGIRVLADASGRLSGTTTRVAGTGAEESAIQGIRGMVGLGALSAVEVKREMERATALVMPSIWYENFPRTLVEAFARGLPVIASNIGALATLVDDHETGLLFNPGDGADLARKMAWAQSNPDQMADMGKRARSRYLAEFTEDRNYEQLMSIYATVLGDGSNR